MARQMKKKEAVVEEAAASVAKKAEVKAEAKVEVKETKKPVAKVKKEFKDTDGIMCRSVVEGRLLFVGEKTGMLYQWYGYGAEYEVEYRDLVIAVRTRGPYVFNPYFIIEDEDFLEEFPVVKKFYEDSYDVKELKNILYMPLEDMKKAIVALPKGALKTLQSIASTEVSNKTLDSIQKIRYLDEVFGTELLLLTEFSEG